MENMRVWKRKLEESKRKEMDEIIEEEPAVQDDVQEDMVDKIIINTIALY